MESGLNNAPPPRLEKLVSRLLPPVVREEVAGDLWERFRSPGHYLAEAAATLPFLIMSQARRQTNGPLFLLQAFTLLTSFGGFQPVSQAGAIPMSLRALIATIPALVALLLRAAYRPGDSWTGARAMGDLAAVLIAVLVAEIVTFLIDPALCLPLGFLIGGLVFSLAMLLVLRSGTDLVPSITRKEAVEPDYQRFRSRVRVKNAIEIGLLLPLLAVAFWFATTARPIVAVIGFSWVVLTLLIIGLNIYGRPRPMPVALAAAGQLAFYRAQLLRQRHVISLAWWWYFVPLFGGLGVSLILRGFVAGQPELAIGGLFGIVLLAIMIARVNHDRKCQLGEKIAALERLAAA